MKLGWLVKPDRFRSRSTWSSSLTAIDRYGDKLAPLTDAELRKAGLALRFRAQSGEPLDDLLPESFALIREVSGRQLGMRHFDVQLKGGLVMHAGGLAEMQTGEGKTLTATLPVALAAFRGQGAHLATANDYLAQRDAELMTPVYNALGLTVGVIQSQSDPAQRTQAYGCDITYGTAKEFGFDFLRQRLEQRRQDDAPLARAAKGQFGRTRFFALVDEADALLIDEARTPLIVSAAPGECPEEISRVYRWACQFVGELSAGQDYQWLNAGQTVELSSAGRRRVRSSHHQAEVTNIPLLDLYSHVELAILVENRYRRDRHYIVRESEIVIVDEFTGRLSEGRRWRDGVHQAIEAKEGLPISPDTGQAARVTMQSFFLLYDRLCGMTGTANHAADEMRGIYDMQVESIPTHRPPRRVHLPDRVYGDQQEKWMAIADEVREIHQTGQPVLIGTRSIDKSEILSRHLTEMRIPHQVLNASQEASEAAIVSQAGQHGQVTVATNMAGRGTDIRLGEGVAALGGLFVIGTELHEAQRIDRQLMGRCGRQGDPGTYRQYLALDDDILRQGLGDTVADRWVESGKQQIGAWDLGSSIFYKAQRKVEHRHFKQRRLLMDRERQKQILHEQMGEDPYLDAPA
jgi:preprotein translocase subunit SecA